MAFDMVELVLEDCDPVGVIWIAGTEEGYADEGYADEGIGVE